MASAANAGARFRQRKISVKQTLQVLRQRDIPDFDIEEQQREIQQIETGVEKGEEEEHHLQQVINASAAKFKGAEVKQVYIPTPDASKVWNEADKFYTRKFNEPDSYIVFSATVEDTSGCPYNMDEIDEEFLEKLNQDFKDEDKCTEDEFEFIASKFDSIVDERQPFLSIDPQQILKFDEIKSVALDENYEKSHDLHYLLAKKLKVKNFKTLYDADTKLNGDNSRDLGILLELFGKQIYEYWKDRRIKRGGGSIFPTLRFEDPSQKDDNNPYTSFRRREFRQARKTRRTDVQSINKLKLLYKDLLRAQSLLQSVAQRELKKNEILQNQRGIFENRKKLKKLVREGNLKLDDIDELFIDKPKKKRLPLGYVPPPSPAPPKESTKNKIKENVQSRAGLKKSSKNDLPKAKGSNKVTDQNVQNNSIHSNKIPQQTIQPYVKLPPCKIPDIDLTTVNTVLRDKLEGIKKAVSDKLIRRRLQDEGWINFTDDPYNPYFDLATPENTVIENKEHLPYSSIVSSMFEVENSREINFSHIFNNNRHYSNNDPNIVKINSFTGTVVKNDRHSSLPEFYDLYGEPSLNNQFGLSRDGINEEFNNKNMLNVSEVLLKVRKRQGRGGRIWIDRKRVKEDEMFEEYLNMPESDDGNEEEICGEETQNLNDVRGTMFSSNKIDKLSPIDEPLFDDGEKMDIDRDSNDGHAEITQNIPNIAVTETNKKKRKNAYDCSGAVKKRLRSRFMFDSELSNVNPIDPSKLNQIGKQTQAVRFGCMLLNKAFDNMHQIRQKQHLLQQQREKLLREQKERERQLHQMRQHQLASERRGKRDNSQLNDERSKSNKLSKEEKTRNKEKDPDNKKSKTKKASNSKANNNNNSNINSINNKTNPDSTPTGANVKVKVESNGSSANKENKAEKKLVNSN
ncbi:Enhancer of polycomb-like protein 1 [Pichia kudriavzevii]|uniref:Enhancer of polycomb-like protein n=1 Tax=Pichia kudriavzevii TaxID=4909 RepID=A0A1V2LK81_PICKU|nr:Enhancer of polycomb-like protein 1 [Pichia kudriavzevii]